MSTVRTFIYGLVDPRSDQVRYVGRSIQPRQRLQGHLGTCTNTLVQGWVGELRTQGLRPSLKILATVVHEADVSPIEQALIVAYDARGVGVLNIRGVLRVQPRVGPPARWRMRHAPPMAPT